MKLRTGQIVCVEFLDHVSNGSEPMPFSVYGRLAVLHKDYVCVDSWCHLDPTKSYDAEIVERFSIVRKAITQIVVLKTTE